MMGDVTSGFSPNVSWIACGLKYSPILFGLLCGIDARKYCHQNPHPHSFLLGPRIFFQLVVVQVVSSLECATILLSCKFHVASWNMGDDLFTLLFQEQNWGFHVDR